EMRQVIQDALAGKKAPPGTNDKEPPGFGPEVKDAKRETPECEAQEALPLSPTGHRLLATGHALPSMLFAVIPTLGVGGPIAILALLFPSVFGGVLVLFRQWAALLLVISLISVVYLVRMLAPGWFRGTWLGTDAGWWFLMTLITLAGLAWSSRRYWYWAADPAVFPSAGRAELLVLWVLTASCT